VVGTATEVRGLEPTALEQLGGLAGGTATASLAATVATVTVVLAVRTATVAAARRQPRRPRRPRRPGSLRTALTRAVGVVAGLGAAISVSSTTGTAGATSDSGGEEVGERSPAATPVLELLDAPTGTTAASGSPVATPVEQRSADRPAPPAGPAPTTPAGAVNRIHVVQPGEHLWQITTDHLRFTTGGWPDDREVVDAWLRLIEVNRDRLVDPDDPDLIHPGLELVLPGPDELTSR